MLRSKVRQKQCLLGFSDIPSLSQEAPSGCPPRFYQSVALSVLACFVEDEDIMTDASVLFNIPELLIIIENSDSEEYEVRKLGLCIYYYA